MSAPAPTYDPPLAPGEDPFAPRVYPPPPRPLTPELRSDVAYSRAGGHSWALIGAAMRLDPNALRRACEDDPEFERVQEKAWAAATWEGEADGMRRLRLVANDSAHEGAALQAAEALVKYARDRRRDDTRLAVEKIRADTRLAVEAARAERRTAERKGAEDEPVYAPVYPIPETPEEIQKRAAREHAARAAEPEAAVYLWGGTHPLGREHGPDASDTRVRVKADWSCPGGHKFGPVYWVVPDPPPLKAAMPGEPDAPAAAAAWGAA